MTTAQEIVDRFPDFAEILQIPEVADLIQKASSGDGTGWSQQYFQSQLWNTQWWKDSSESQRKWQILKLNDPASASQQAGQMGTSIFSTAMALGIHLTPAETQWYTELSLSHGWDQAELTHQLVTQTAQSRIGSGSISATQSGLKATAANYGVGMSDTRLRQWADRIQTGAGTQQGFEEEMRSHAKALYPTLAKELDAGHTVQQLADPYLQIAGQVLGVNPDTLSLQDPKWQRALQSKDPATGKMVGPMNTLDWQRTIMTDASYGYQHSANGLSAGYDLTDALQKTFGLKG